MNRSARSGRRVRVRNDVNSWGLAARALHWTVAALVLIQLATGWLEDIEPDRSTAIALIRGHFQFGVVLFGLTAMRILWRLGNRPPAPPPGQPRWADISAQVVHVLLYALLIVLPVTGYLMWLQRDMAMDVFGVVSVPRAVPRLDQSDPLFIRSWYIHYFSGWVLAGLVVVHVGAALWHQLVRRDGLIERMIGRP